MITNNEKIKMLNLGLPLVLLLWCLASAASESQSAPVDNKIFAAAMRLLPHDLSWHNNIKDVAQVRGRTIYALSYFDDSYAHSPSHLMLIYDVANQRVMQQIEGSSKTQGNFSHDGMYFTIGRMANSRYKNKFFVYRQNSLPSKTLMNLSLIVKRNANKPLLEAILADTFSKRKSIHSIIDDFLGIAPITYSLYKKLACPFDNMRPAFRVRHFLYQTNTQDDHDSVFCLSGSRSVQNMTAPTLQLTYKKNTRKLIGAKVIPPDHETLKANGNSLYIASTNGTYAALAHDETGPWFLINRLTNTTELLLEKQACPSDTDEDFTYITIGAVSNNGKEFSTLKNIVMKRAPNMDIGRLVELHERNEYQAQREPYASQVIDGKIFHHFAIGVIITPNNRRGYGHLLEEFEGERFTRLYHIPDRLNEQHVAFHLQGPSVAPLRLGEQYMPYSINLKNLNDSSKIRNTQDRLTKKPATLESQVQPRLWKRIARMLEKIMPYVGAGTALCSLTLAAIKAFQWMSKSKQNSA